MRYSDRFLRTVDMLALVLVGFGLAAACLGGLRPQFRWIFGGLVLAVLGFVLNAKLRRILRNGGYEDSGIGEPAPAAPLDE